MTRKLNFSIFTVFHRRFLSVLPVNQTSTVRGKLRFVLYTIFTIMSYMVFEKILSHLTYLPRESYYKPFIYFEFVKHFFSGKNLLFSIPVVGFLIYFRNAVLVSWKEFEKGSLLKFIIVMMSGLLTWFYISYDYNLFFNQSHFLDRILLFVLLISIFWKPIFVFLFLTVLLPVVNQFKILAGYSGEAIVHLPLSILILFSVFLICFFFTKKYRIHNFIFLSCCIIAAHYFPSGLGKLNMNWIVHDKLYYLLSATYTSGWLGFLEPETITVICKWFQPFNQILKIFTLIIEVGAIFFFAHRWFARFLLLGFVCVHLGAAFLTGIFFWIWMVIAIMMFIFITKKNLFFEVLIFSRFHFLTGFFLILTSSYWCKPAKLSWYDSHYNYTFRFEAELESGRKVQLMPRFFEPYDIQFTSTFFNYLHRTPFTGCLLGSF